jgi:putative ATPase
MPECDCILAQCIVYLAEAPKSVRSYQAYGKAKALVNAEQAYPVPLHIRNAPTKLMKSLGYGKEYLYEPAFAHPVHQTFMPPELESKVFLRDDDDVEDKRVDEDKLQGWEHHHGKEWEGRHKLASLGAL